MVHGCTQDLDRELRHTYLVQVSPPFSPCLHIRGRVCQLTRGCVCQLNKSRMCQLNKPRLFQLNAVGHVNLTELGSLLPAVSAGL